MSSFLAAKTHLEAYMHRLKLIIVTLESSNYWLEMEFCDLYQTENYLHRLSSAYWYESHRRNICVAQLSMCVEIQPHFRSNWMFSLRVNM
jgi:hypothetical protein